MNCKSYFTGKIILFFVVFFSFTKSFSYNLTSFSLEKAANDTSKKYFESLIAERDFYQYQIRKDNIPSDKKLTYSQRLDEVNNKLTEYYKQKKELSAGNEEAIKQVTYDSLNVETNDELNEDLPPVFYSHELGTHLFGMAVSFMNNKYSAPYSIFYERPLTEQISAGLIAGYFVEHNVISEEFPKENIYYSTKTENYQYHYVTVCLKGAYHFINPAKPLLGINPEKFDIYLSGFLGASITGDPNPYLKNNKYDKEALKKGINYGIAPGVRYFFDEHLAVYVEAGYTRTGFLNVGAAYRLIKSKKDQPKGKAAAGVSAEDEAVPEKDSGNKTEIEDGVEEESQKEKEEKTTTQKAPQQKLTPKEKAKLQKEKQKAAKTKQLEKQKAAKAKQIEKQKAAKAKQKARKN